MSVKGKYRILQGLYWMNACVAYGYGISYLKEMGFSAGYLGILFAVFSLIAALIQPVVGRIVDKSKRFHWKTVLLILTAAMMALTASLLVVKDGIASALLFCFYAMFCTITMPMINVVCFYYEHRGTDMNFGLARGIGSLTYALLSLLIGRLVAPLGMEVIIWIGLIVAAATFLSTLSFPYYGPIESTEKKTDRKAKKNPIAFLRYYPAFFLMVAACACFMTFQNMTSNYMVMILEEVGGNNANLGVVLALAAVFEIPVMFLTGALVKRFPTWWLMTFAGAVYAVRGVLYYFAKDVTGIYLLQILQPFSYAVLIGVQVYFSDQCMEEEDLATGQAFLGMSMAIGSTLGFFAGGVFIDRFGVGSMLLASSAIAACGTVLAVISSLMCTAKKKAEIRRNTT